jgi:hypothetical protein
MVPRTIRKQLAQLRRRERLYGLAWGAARWLAGATMLLAAACATDWLIDCRQETPWGLRLAMLLVQGVAGATLGLIFVARPLFRRMSNSRLALYVEDKVPRLGHRLISAVQLNQRGARTSGMSPELIAEVTRRAENDAAGMSFADLADRRRLRWSLWLAIPVLLAGALPVVLSPRTVWALLARQLLVDRDIPRSIHLESQTAEAVWPAGEEGLLRFRVSGEPLPDDLQGQVRLDPEGLPSESYPLTLASRSGPGEATYLARVPPSSVDFQYRAWLSTSRTRRVARVHYEPRPVVTQQEAWVVLPAYCGLRPGWHTELALQSIPQVAALPRPPLALLAAEPFEEYQRGADLVRRLPNSAGRVAIRTQKPVAAARLEVLGRAGPSGEVVRREVPLALHAGGQHAEASFLLEPGDTGYRVAVRDTLGFENADPPRRAIRSVPVDPPQVALLPELFRFAGDVGSPEDYEVEGMPVPLGRKIRIGYSSSAPYGLGRAQLRYRVLPANRPGDEPPPDDEIPWLRHPLAQVAASATAGPFELQRGLFQRSGEDDQVEFHAVPSPDPDRVGGREGGGRFDFQTRGIPDGKGGLLDLKEGERIEYYVEVFDRIPDPDRPPGRSEVRVKTIVSIADWLAWKREKERQEERLNLLAAKQRGLFPGVMVPGDDNPSRGSPLSATRPRAERNPYGASPYRPVPAGTPSFGRSWQLLGPFPNPDDRGHAIAYPPETEPMDLDQEFDGLKGKMRWRPHFSDNDRIDLEKFFAHGEAGVAYAVCWFRCDRPKAVLATGSDDGIKVWLNGKLVVDKAVHREAVPAEDKTPVELGSGWNLLLVKVDNKFGTWAFYLELQDPANGRRLDRIDVRLVPEEDKSDRFVRNWLLLGPFPNPDDRGYDREYPPELERPVDPNKEHDGKQGTIRWKRYQSEKDRIDLLHAFGLPFQDAAGVAYAVCWVHCEKADPSILLAAGADNGIKVWINRQIVLSNPSRREGEPANEAKRIKLSAAWNEVLVKVDNKFGRWGFHLELGDPETGRSMKGISFRLAPPDGKEKK